MAAVYAFTELMGKRDGLPHFLEVLLDGIVECLPCDTCSVAALIPPEGLPEETVAASPRDDAGNK